MCFHWLNCSRTNHKASPARLPRRCLPTGLPPANLQKFACAFPSTPQFQTLAYNGSKWGPLLRLERGRLYEISVTNKDIEAGTSVHWHGQRLLNGEHGREPGLVWSYSFQPSDINCHESS